jgi:hypothetical protein
MASAIPEVGRMETIEIVRPNNKKKTFWMYVSGERNELKIAKHDIIDTIVRPTPPIPPIILTPAGLV